MANDKTQKTIDEVEELAEEVTASADIASGGADLADAKALMHAWIDEASAIVTIPALGRVALVHPSGVQSTIISPELPFRMSKPVNFKE